MASIVRGMGRHHLDTNVTGMGSTVTTYRFQWQEFPLIFMQPEAGTIDVDKLCAFCGKPIQVRVRSKSVLRGLKRRGGGFAFAWATIMVALGWWFYTNLLGQVEDETSLWVPVLFLAAIAFAFGPIVWGLSLIGAKPLILRKGSTKRHDVDRLEIVQQQ